MRVPEINLRAGLLAMLALLVLVAGCKFDGAYDLPLPGSGVDKDESFEVTAEFDDVLNVVPRSPVMVDDVPVGEITEVERKAGTPRSPCGSATTWSCPAMRWR